MSSTMRSTYVKVGPLLECIYLQKGESLMNVDTSGDAQDVGSQWRLLITMEEEVKNAVLNPPWYRWLDFGVSDWGWFTVQVFDNSGEKLSCGFI